MGYMGDGGGRKVRFNEKVLDYRTRRKLGGLWSILYWFKHFQFTLNPFLLILHKIVLGNKFNIVGIRI